jgi:hypothetical protein
MPHLLENNPALANIATEGTRPLLELAETSGGDAGAALKKYLYGPDSSFGEFELRLALGTLANAVITLNEHVARLEAMQQ